MAKLMALQLAEIKGIAQRNGGVVHPEDVVKFARNERTALHQSFEWDDTKAAEQYRCEQARRLIRVMVEIVPHDEHETKVQAFVALKSERYDDGGYRHFPTVMKTQEGRESVLETAIWELEAFKIKYSELKEMAGVFAEINKLKSKVRK